MSTLIHALINIDAYLDIHKERLRAHHKHQDKPGGSMEQHVWDDADWLPVLVEELGEVARNLCEHRHGNLTSAQFQQQLREELIQVAAMAAAWVGAIDGQQLTPGGKP